MADVGARIAVHGGPGDVAGRAREEIREDALRLNDAAVAEARFAGRLGETVDERDASAACRKRKRRGDADDSGAKHDGVDSLRGHAAAFSLSRTRVAIAASASILILRSYRPRLEGTNGKLRPR